MTTTTNPGGGSTVLLSHLLKHAVLDAKGQRVGRIADAIVTLRGDDYPILVGFAARVGSTTVFVPLARIADIDAHRVELRSAELDLRPFERRHGEVLLLADILGHRLIDIDRAALVRAYDAQLAHTADGSWIVRGLDVHKRRLIHLGGNPEHHPIRDWRSFETLITGQDLVVVRSPFGRLHRLRPAQIADLIEDASGDEQDLLLAHVHTDPELEADVFGELDDDQQVALLRTRPDEQVAKLLARMRADDAADALMVLPQHKRQLVLDLLPDPQRTKVTTLLGYNSLTAGGLMGVEYLAADEHDTIAHTLERLRALSTQHPEALTTLYSTNQDGQLVGALSLVQALQTDPALALSDAAEPDPVRARPDEDLIDITRRMADFNLLTMPVVDDRDHILGVITIDDVLEAAIPANWRHRETRRPSSTPTEASAPSPDTGPEPTP